MQKINEKFLSNIYQREKDKYLNMILKIRKNRRFLNNLKLTYIVTIGRTENHKL
jgi:hypothetical protein